MKPLIILCSVFLFAVAAYVLTGRSVNYPYAGRIALCAMFLFTSIGHFVLRKGMVKMLPDLMPFRMQVVTATGIMEMVAALALLLPFYPCLLGWLLLLFLLFLLPANIYAAIHRINYENPEIAGPGPRYLWFRIPLQLLFMACVYGSLIYPHHCS